MNGLRKFIIAHLLFWLSVSAHSTEISSQLLKVSPLAYYGFEFLDLNSDGVFNVMGTGYLSMLPVGHDQDYLFSPSFLGSHAGHAVYLQGHDGFKIELDRDIFFNSSEPIVIGFFMSPQDKAGSVSQCLFSIDDKLALLKGEKTLVAEDGALGVRLEEIEEFSGGAVFLTIKESQVSVWVNGRNVLSYPFVELSDEDRSHLYLGRCSEEAFQKFAPDAEGLVGGLDEFVVLSSQALRTLQPILPTLLVEEEQQYPEEEFSVEGMLRQLISYASQAVYPLEIEWEDSRYLRFLGAERFDAFVTSSIDCCVGAQIETESSELIDVRHETVNDGLYVMTPRDEISNAITTVAHPVGMGFSCEERDCVSQEDFLRRGIAFGRPANTELVEFGLIRETLSELLEAHPVTLSFGFNRSIKEEQDFSDKISLFKLDGVSWQKIDAGLISVSGGYGGYSAIDLRFFEPLVDGSYRVEFETSIESRVSEKLAQKEIYEFTVKAKTLVIDSPGALPWEDDGTHLVVDGVSVWISGDRHFASVKVINGGVLKGDRWVSIRADRIEIEEGSSIDVSRSGMAGENTIGIYSGGSHGGQGGFYQSYSVKPPYGDFRFPLSAGSGGRGTGNNFSYGGGALQIKARELVLEGFLRADGQSVDYIGAGSGGSILVVTDLLEVGVGALISAEGGVTGCCSFSGGGGGRIAIHYAKTEGRPAHEIASAKGSLGRSSYRHGAAGTVYLNNTADGFSELIVDNSGVDRKNAALTPLDLGDAEPSPTKVTLINANVTLSAANLSEVIARDSAVKLQVAEIGSLHGTGSAFTQERALQLGTLDLSGGSWQQNGNPLTVGTYRMAAGEHDASGAFSLLNSNELLVDGYTLALSQPGQWSKVSVINQGRITTSPSTMQLQITADEFFVDSSSSIDLTGKGPLADERLQPGEAGSHGGRGAFFTTASGQAYGDFRAPTQPGTGGRSRSSQNHSRGGGALRITAQQLRLDGRLEANGSSQGVATDAGASGGSIWLQAGSIELGEQARIEANGDSSPAYGVAAGGGGRIAVEFNQVDKTALLERVSARGANSRGPAADSSSGTVYLRNLASGQEELLVDNTGVYHPLTLVTPVEIGPDAFSGRLKLRNAAVELRGSSVAEVSADAATLSVEVDAIGSIHAVNSSITQKKALSVGELQVQGGLWSMGGFALDAQTHSFKGGTLDMSGAFSGAANDLLVDGHTLILHGDGHWQKVRVANGGVLTTALAPDQISKQVVITAEEIEVDASSRIDVSARGPLGVGVVTSTCGGSYGGLGGAQSDCSPNPVYGNALEPVDFGTGGIGTRGGGAIKLSSRTLTLAGKLLADGASSYGVPIATGSGSGGSIWVDTQMLSGTSASLISANGGTYSAPGGGGRIAVYYSTVQGINLQTQVKAAPGASVQGHQPQPGTVHLENRIVPAAVLRTDLAVAENRQIEAFFLDFINAVDPATVNASTVRLVAAGQEQSLAGIEQVSPVRFKVKLQAPLQDAAYSLSVGGVRTLAGRGMDQNGNGIEDEVGDVFLFSFVVDHAPPAAPSISSPSVAPAVNTLNQRTIALSGGRSEPGAILVNDVVRVGHGEGAWSIPSYALAEGDSELWIRQQDLAGNLSEPVQLLFSIDSVRPVLVGRFPSAASLNEPPASLWVQFKEDGSGLDLANSRVLLKQGDVSIPGDLSLEGDTLRLTPAMPLLEGSYQWQISLRDHAGNELQQTQYFVLDYSPPAAPLLAEYPQVTALASIQLQVINAEPGNTLVVRNDSDEVLSRWNGSVVNLSLASGDNTFHLAQVDPAGNVGPSTEVRVRFDNQPPASVAIQIDPEGDGTEVEVSWHDYDAAANGGDIAYYRVYTASHPFSSVEQAQLLANVATGQPRLYRVTALPRGEVQHFAVVAVDQAGLALDVATSTATVPKDIVAPEDASALSVRSSATSLQLSWQPSANTAGDLAGYAVYVGGSDPQRIALPSDADLFYELSDLAQGSATPLRLVAVDQDGNESAGQRDPGVTWLANPVGLQLESQSNRVRASWAAVQPNEYVRGYRVYMADAAFNSVAGMQPRLVRDASFVDALIGGLVNGRNYHVAVTTVNTSGGENPQVQSISVTPASDVAGPVLQSFGWMTESGLQQLGRDAAVELVARGEWRLQANDESGIARVAVRLNGASLGQMQLQGAEYRFAWQIASVEDGLHELGVTLVDTLGNATELTFPLRVALQAPEKPVLKLSSAQLRTNEAEQRLMIQGLPGAMASVSQNGSNLAEEILLDLNGQAQWPITLQEGENLFSARQRHASRSQFSSPADDLSIVLDSTLPETPPGLQATARAMGVVQLGWTAIKGVAGYNLYASSQPFDVVATAGVHKLNDKPLISPSFQHEAKEEGTQYYRVTSVNLLGSESLPSQIRSAVVDRTSPRIELIQYRSLGAVAEDGRHAPARIDVRVRASEPLRNAPFLSLDVPQGVSIPIRLAQAANDPLIYEGGFDLSDQVPSGLLYARISAHDKVGNEGTEVLEGNTLRVDTRGPEVLQLSLLPGHPVQNLVEDGQGREVQVIVRLSEEPAATPRLIPLLDGVAWPAQNAPLELSLDGQSQPGAPLYTARFRLPVSAGASAVQQLGFDYLATDDLDNRSQRIHGRREFQVYQGDLPPLEVPLGLSAKALAAGRVALTWRNVDEADSYEIYRRADDASDFSSIGRVRELAFTDDLPAAGLADGRYHYRVVSIRQENDQEALSLPSESVAVHVLSQAPQSPRELSAELTGGGIVLRWLAPEQGQVIGYNLYRLNVAEGASVDVAGLEPIRSNLVERMVLDSHPSDTDHLYTVTALDAAGNESAPADGVYLNAGLLPVRDLRIVREDGQPASLSWSHNGQNVAGYNVYEGVEASRRKLNERILAEPLYVDAGGASGEKLYSVTAVDGNGVESLPHTLLLPQLKIEARPEQRFERGIFNQVHYRISNLGSQELKRLRLRLGFKLEGNLQWQQSEPFDVAPGALAEVPIVVAGHAQLPGVVPVLLEVQYIPQPGEQVVLQGKDSLIAGENSVVAQVLGEQLTRGGEGQLRLRLENPSDVPVELVTARNYGKQASDELRLLLEDLQGNVLSSAPVHMALGNGVVTLRDGRTVARVGAHDVLELGPLAIPVPQAAPEEVRVRFVADHQYYQAALPGELKIGGLRASRELTLLDTPYYGELTAVEPPQIQAGDSVVITGRALARDSQQPVPGAELSLVLSVRGFEQILSVTADAEGNFSRRYISTATDSGTYQVSVVHPQIQSRPIHGTFAILGASATPEVFQASFPRNHEQQFAIRVEAGHDTPLRNVRLQYLQPEGASGLPAGLQVRQSAPLNLAASQKGTLTLHVSGSNSAAASGLLDYQVVADGLSRPLGKTRIQYNLVEALPRAVVEPRQLSTGMARESEQVETIRLSSTGLDALRNLRLSLLDEQGAPAPEWAGLRVRAEHPELAVGATLPIEVAFNPGASVAEGDHYFTLRIESDNHPRVDVPMRAAVTQSGKGGVVFQVENIYTGTLDEQGQRVLGLKGARVKLQNRAVLSAEYAGVTNAQGQLLLEELPAGEYSYRISAWDHEDITGQFWIKPGVVRDERVFLMNKLVTVEWSVKEITLEDRYDIILNATFKTNVPTALVMIEPLSISLPAMRKGDVMQGELTLTNYGLIRADNVRGELPAGDARVKIEYLRPVPATLEAGDVAVIPYRIVALQSFDPDDELSGAAGCWDISYSGVIHYQSQCINGQIVPGRASVLWSSTGRRCSSATPPSPVTIISGGGVSWGGGAGGLIPRGTGFGDVKACAPEPSCDACDPLGGGHGGAQHGGGQ